MSDQGSGGLPGRIGATELYRRVWQHLTLGTEVPSWGSRHQGAPWDTARQLQQKMRLTNITWLANIEAAGDRGTERRWWIFLPSASNPPWGRWCHRCCSLVPPTPCSISPRATPTDSIPARATGTTMDPSLPERGPLYCRTLTPLALTN